MFESVYTPGSYTTEDFLSGHNLTLIDETVAEVFAMMLGFATQAASAPPDAVAPDLQERTAIVGFSGSMRGSCEVRMTLGAAREIASAMLGGAPIGEEDESVSDAVGELCNMIAGGWKNRVPSLSSLCALSPPTVVSGSRYRVHMSKPSAKIERAFHFEAYGFHLTLQCEDRDAA
jgi:chemotaxis protein CheX